MSKISETMNYLTPARDKNGSPVLQHEYDRLKTLEQSIATAKPVAWMNVDERNGAMFFRSSNTINAVPLIVMPIISKQPDSTCIYNESDEQLDFHD